MRKFTKFYSVLIIFLLCIYPINTKANDCGWVFDNFTSPICTDARYIFWTGPAITLGFSLFRDTFIKDLTTKTVAKNHMGHYGEDLGELGNGFLNGGYFLTQLLFGGKEGNKRAEHIFEASFYSLGPTMGLKKSIKEERPGSPGDFDSFPSGHSSSSFAFASAIASQHG